MRVSEQALLGLLSEAMNEICKTYGDDLVVTRLDRLPKKQGWRMIVMKRVLKPLPVAQKKESA